MRTTERKLICDRCGYSEFVEGFNHYELKKKVGWSRYSTAPIQNSSYMQHQNKDLCEGCTSDMYAMATSQLNRVVSTEIVTIEDEAQLLEWRKLINKELRFLRSGNG